MNELEKKVADQFKIEEVALWCWLDDAVPVNPETKTIEQRD